MGMAKTPNIGHSLNAALAAQTVTLAAGETANLFVSLEAGTRLRALRLELGAGAVCDCTVLQALPAGESAEIELSSELAGGSEVRWHLVSVGGGEVHQTLRSHLASPDAKSSVDWIALADDGQRLRITAENIFDGPRGGGETAMRLAAKGRGRIDAHGLIEIGEHGGGTQTYLSQKALMLDPQARIEAVPALEIRTNDVRASHGATVTRLTAEDVFACAARGIAPAEARTMLTEGFLQELLSRVPEAHRERARALLLPEEREVVCRECL